MHVSNNTNNAVSHIKTSYFSWLRSLIPVEDEFICGGGGAWRGVACRTGSGRPASFHHARPASEASVLPAARRLFQVRRRCGVDGRIHAATESQPWLRGHAVVMQNVARGVRKRIEGVGLERDGGRLCARGAVRSR